MPTYTFQDAIQILRDLNVDGDDSTRLQAIIDMLEKTDQRVQALEQSNANLQRERQRDLQASEWLAKMSHDLRTPLNSIIGYSELLVDDLKDNVDEMTLQDLEAIHTSGHQLLLIVNDMLDFARIRAGRLELKRSQLDLNQLMEAIGSMSRSLNEDRPKVAMRFDVPPDLPVIYADAERIQQVIMSLLNNAIRMTTEGSIQFSAKDEGDWVVFEVVDSGEGLEPEQVDVVFDQYQMVKGNITMKALGGGMGLPIARHLVELHGGSVWVISQKGHGSTFGFRLPGRPDPSSE
ncbi:MAG: HAMP domain-containing histidine kinase [Chloroflexi bacterium]|nr:HAMP domain-containing histidine kinase [Chloroflexota bacterium]